MTWLTREEFGVGLFEAVACFGGRAWYREQYRVQVTNLAVTVEERKKRLADLKAGEARMDERILALMPTLDPEDQRGLMQRYERGE